MTSQKLELNKETKEFFEIIKNKIGIKTQEKKQCFVFLIGDHNSGKSYLKKKMVNGKNGSISESKTTFAIEYSFIYYSSDINLHIIEVNNSSSQNIMLLQYIKENYHCSCVAFMFDLSNLNNIEKTINAMYNPFVKTIVSEIQSNELKDQLFGYYSKAYTSRSEYYQPEVCTFIPIMFIGSKSDTLEIPSSELDCYISNLRIEAFHQGAGFALSNAEGLIDVLVSLGLRRDITNEPSSGLIPPGLDHQDKIPEPTDIPDEKTEESHDDVPEIPSYNEFIKKLVESNKK